MSHHARLDFVQSCCHPSSADALAHGLAQDRVPRVAFLGFRELAQAELFSEQYRLHASIGLFSLVPHKQNLEFQISVEEQQNYDSFSILTAALGCLTPTDEFQGGAGLELLLLNQTFAEAKARSSHLTHGISPQGSLIFWWQKEKD